MKEYLLIILILLFQLKTKSAFTQIITISQTGRKIISPTKSGNQITVNSFSNEIPETKERMDGWQLVKPPNYMDSISTKIVSTPLNREVIYNIRIWRALSSSFTKRILACRYRFKSRL
jgi:hypothetical protein